jgi:hypothetical protein
MMRKELARGKKGELSKEVLGYLILILFFLAIMFIAYMIVTGKGTSAIEYVKNLFRFGS